MMLAALASVSLYLVCNGEGISQGTSTTSASATDNHGNEAQATGVTDTPVGYTDQATIEIRPDHARVRLPLAIVPNIHGGEGGGWFEMRNVVIADREITGKVAVNFLNHPAVRIDRLSGNIAINGKGGSFTGSCQAASADTPTKF